MRLDHFNKGKTLPDAFDAPISAQIKKSLLAFVAASTLATQ
jgi:hypothetical protein